MTPTSLAAWPVTQFNVYDIDQAYIYFLLYGDEVVYVGMTTRLHNRIHYHQTRRDSGVTDKGAVLYEPGQFQWDTVWYMPVAPEERKRVEQEIIELLQPRYNRTLFCSKPSTNGKEPHAPKRKKVRDLSRTGNAEADGSSLAYRDNDPDGEPVFDDRP